MEPLMTPYYDVKSVLSWSTMYYSSDFYGNDTVGLGIRSEYESGRKRQKCLPVFDDVWYKIIKFASIFQNKKQSYPQEKVVRKNSSSEWHVLGVEGNHSYLIKFHNGNIRLSTWSLSLAWRPFV